MENNRVLSAFVAVVLLVIGATMGQGASLTAQTLPGGDCEKNMCDVQRGKCTVVSHNWNCSQTDPTFGCTDSQCVQ